MQVQAIIAVNSPHMQLKQARMPVNRPRKQTSATEQERMNNFFHGSESS